MESPCECGIEPPGSISHGVSEVICHTWSHVSSTSNRDNNKVNYVSDKAVLLDAHFSLLRYETDPLPRAEVMTPGIWRLHFGEVSRFTTR